MLVFTTKIPVSDEMTSENFIDLCSEWVYNSPHYHSLIIDYGNDGTDYETQKENITCHITCYKDNSTDIIAFRLINIDNNKVWTLDLLFVSDGKKKYILVQNNLDSTAYSPKFPRNNKPHFIKWLMEKNYGLKERFFEIDDKPLLCNVENAKVYAEVINGKTNKTLPMVYVSRDSDGYRLNCDKLAKRLSGMAYVVVEQDKETSYILKDLTESKNAHNGYIGVYCPGTDNYQLYSPSDLLSGHFETDIVIIIQQILLNRMSSDEYNWVQIQLLKAKANVLDSENLNKDFEYFMALAADREKELIETINRLRKNNDSLTCQIGSFKARESDGTICLNTSIRDFYTKEQHDFILNILSEIRNKVGGAENGKCRRYEILNSIIESNTCVGEGKRVSGELRNIFKPGFKWNASTKNKLGDLGFTIEDGSGHKKIVFHDPKYMFTISGTPGDDRGIKNLLSEIENGISITKKIL